MPMGTEDWDPREAEIVEILRSLPAGALDMLLGAARGLLVNCNERREVGEDTETPSSGVLILH